MALTAVSGRLVAVNGAFCRLLGYSEVELLGMSFQDVTHPEDVQANLDLRASALRDGGRAYGMDKRYIRRDGSLVSVRLTVAVIDADDGRPLHLLGQIEDITELKQLQDDLERDALHDHLTGAANRVLFGDRLTHALARSDRPPGSPAVLFLDLDGFKQINDEHGHAGGDTVLRAAAERIGAVIRRSDTVARFGGDEFVILLEGAASAGPQSVPIAERILQSIAEPVSCGDGFVRMTASAGVAWPEDDRVESAENLIGRADAAMYAAKRRGGNGLAIARRR